MKVDYEGNRGTSAKNPLVLTPCGSRQENGPDSAERRGGAAAAPPSPARRKAVDELSEQCSWPPPSGCGGGSGGLDDPAAPTLCAAVRQQEAQLRQLLSASGLQQEQQKQYQHKLHQDLAAFTDENKRWLEVAQQDISELSRETVTRQEAMAESLLQLHEQLQALAALPMEGPREREDGEQLADRVRAMEECLPRLLESAKADADLGPQVGALQRQLKVLQEEKKQVASALMAMGEQQHKLEAMQGELLSKEHAGAPDMSELRDGVREALSEVVEGELRQLQAEQRRMAESLVAVGEQHEQQLLAERQRADERVQEKERHARELESTLELMGRQQRELLAQQQRQEGELKRQEGELRVAVAALQEQRDQAASAARDQGEASAAAAGSGAGEAALKELREEVAAVASAVNVLFGRVGGLCDRVDQDPRDLHAELSALGSTVSRLTDRVDRMDIPKELPPRRAPTAFHTSPSAHDAPINVHAHTPEGGCFAETFDASSPLRDQIAQLVGNARRLSVEKQADSQWRSRTAPSTSSGPPAPSSGARDEDLLQRPRSPLRGDGVTPGSEAFGSPTQWDLGKDAKVPNPRQWLMEPLSVAIGRGPLFDSDYLTPPAAAGLEASGGSPSARSAATEILVRGHADRQRRAP